mgnify:CR=1 FL=1
MRVLVSVDAQLWKTPDGKIWSKTMYDYSFWERYLDVFEEILIVSRIGYKESDEVNGFLRCDGKHVEFFELPMAIGAKSYIRNISVFLKSATRAVKNIDCAIIRLPSVSGMFIEMAFKKTNKPYAVEVVVDPQNAYSDNCFYKYIFTWLLRKTVKNANGVSYVTRFDLQKKYPAYSLIHGNDEKHFSEYYSSIRLKKDYYYKVREFINIRKLRIIHVANNMNNYIKGHKTALEVVQKLTIDGIDCNITFIGDGKKRNEFEDYACYLGIKEKVDFVGVISNPDLIRQKLIEADLFLFPSSAEGLPRVLIEAMAVGLPCLASPINGIPELLPGKYLFYQDDIEGFVTTIKRLYYSTSELNKMSADNFLKAQEYEDSILQGRRNAFFKKLRFLVENENSEKSYL